jgi:ferredoxin
MCCLTKKVVRAPTASAQNNSRDGKMAYVIAEPCIGTKDTACVDACPVDCIHPKKDEVDYEAVTQLYIDPIECIDCGACVPVCPVSAIFALDDLPEKWAHFTEMNAQYFKR